LVLASLASFMFFTSQLTDRLTYITDQFELPNVSQDLSASNTQIIKSQTDLNLYKYLQAKGYLDEFSYYGDTFIQNYEIANSQTAENADVNDAMKMMTELKTPLKEALLSARDRFDDDFTAPLMIDGEPLTEEELQTKFETELKSLLQSKATALSGNTDEQAKRDYKNYLHTMNMVGNNGLIALILVSDFDAMNDEELYGFIKITNLLIVNDLSIIQLIKDFRIKWSDVMNEIELRTIEADTYYTQDSYEERGGIRYTSYDLDSQNARISITGETKSLSTTTFTNIANLIDALNRSEMFGNAGMNSFSKSGSSEDGYTASIRMTLDLARAEAMEITSEENEASPDDLLLEDDPAMM